MRVLTLALLLLVAFAVLGVGRASAAGAPSFPVTLQSASSIVMPPGDNYASLFMQPDLYGGSTSCGSAGFCAEVGGYDADGDAGNIVVPINDGVASPAVQVALPGNAEDPGDAGLNSISCYGADSCVSVGSYDAWAPAPIPDVSATPSQIDGPTVNDTEALLVPVSNGEVGTAVEVALPSNAIADSTGEQYAQLDGVSCDPSGACVAVGFYTDNNDVQQAMVVPISGGSAGPAAEVTLPADAKATPDAGLNSVSCNASGACVAVGYYTDSDGNQQALVTPVSSAGALGTSSKLTLPADASSTPDASLWHVSCPASGDCAAIGRYEGTGDGSRYMAASISSAGVALPATDVLATLGNAADPADVWPTAVGCGSGGCNIVGSFAANDDSYEALVIPVSGSGGATVLGNETQVKLPGDAVQVGGDFQQFAGLFDISCPAQGACLASGGYMADYQGLNFPGYSGEIVPFNINGLLVGVNGSSVDTGSSEPLPADASAYGRLSFGAGVGCGATGSCAVTSVYLKGFASGSDLLATLECLAHSEGEGDCSFSGSIQPYIVSAQAPLTITPGSIHTTVTAGVTSVSLSSAASGGWGPYQWSVANGNTLPDGLSLDPFTGEISGTPQAAGPYTLWVRADSPGVPAQNAEASLKLTVGAPATPGTTPVVTSAAVTSPSSSITPASKGHRVPNLIVVRGNLRDHGGAVGVHLHCHSWGTCVGAVSLSWHGQTISGATHLTIPAGQTGWVTVHLNARGMKDTAGLHKPRHGFPTMNVTVVPTLTVGQGIPHDRPMWVM